MSIYKTENTDLSQDFQQMAPEQVDTHFLKKEKKELKVWGIAMKYCACQACTGLVGVEVSANTS